MDKVTFFLHITKTAGGSLKALFEKSLQDQVVFFNASQEADMPEIHENVKMIFGHFTHGIHEKFGLDATYACVLRNPLNRTISHYYHLFNNDKSQVGDRIRSGGANINEYFAENTHWEFSNFMTKILAGTSNQIDKRSESKLFRLALNNLNNLQYIGIFEYLDLSLLKLQSTFDIHITDVPQVNIGQYKLAEISKETIHRILRLNRMDFLLYDIGVERFWKNIYKL
jgi:hypothetical protein